MLSRRKFLKMPLMLIPTGLLTSPVNGQDFGTEGPGFYMPEEGDLHTRTWMAFGASERIWGRKLLRRVQKDLANIALVIANYEPVTMLVRKADLELAESLTEGQVELIVCELDDLWIRDTGPVFVTNHEGSKRALDFNFNGWGNKQKHENDAKLAKFIASNSVVESISTNLVLEGGAIEVDGVGTAIITESCVLNDNRNPSLSKLDCEQELKEILGLEKIIWLPGIKGMDITDGHTDFYARFAKPGVVVAAYDPDPASFDHDVTKQHLKILRSATDARGQSLRVEVLETPSSIRPRFENDEFAAGYINFYVCNGAVIAPEFGDSRADNRAKSILQQLYPDRDIVLLDIDGIAAGGGGIHCATQQEPLSTLTNVKGTLEK